MSALELLDFGRTIRDTARNRIGSKTRNGMLDKNSTE
jgi:hypothetical protein